MQWKASWSICYFLIILRGFFASISKLRWLVLCLSSSCPHTFLLNLAVKRMWKQSQFCFPFAKQLRDPENVASIRTGCHIPEFEHLRTHSSQIRKTHEKLWFIDTHKHCSSNWQRWYCCVAVLQPLCTPETLHLSKPETKINRWNWIIFLALNKSITVMRAELLPAWLRRTGAGLKSGTYSKAERESTELIARKHEEGAVCRSPSFLQGWIFSALLEFLFL